MTIALVYLSISRTLKIFRPVEAISPSSVLYLATRLE